MKILLVNKFHWDRDGATRCYFDTARILEEHGHEVAFFAMESPENIAGKWNKYFVEGVDYNNEKQSFGRKLIMAAKMIYNWEANRNLEALIKEFRPDVAHLHVFYHQISPSIINVLKKHKIRVVMTLHDYKLICPNYSLLVRDRIWERTKGGKYYRTVIDKAVKNSYLKSIVCATEAYIHDFLGLYDKIDAFISPSRFLIGKFAEFGFQKHIDFIPNPLVDFAADREISLGDYVFYFGRLSEEKGVRELVKAFARLKYRLVMAGAGPLENELKSMIRESGTDNIQLVGYKSGTELFDLIAGARLIIVPSKWYENAPYTVIESMAMGKVVLAADIGGLHDMVQDGVTGLHFTAGDPAALERVVTDNYDNFTKLTDIGQKAKYYVKEANNKENYYKQLIKLYKNVQ